MKKNKKKVLSLRHAFTPYIIVTVVSFTLLLIVSAVMVSLFAFLEKNFFLYIFVGAVFVIFLGYLLSIRRINKKIYSLFYDDIFLKSSENMDKMLLNRDDLSLYQANQYSEVSEINAKVRMLNETLSHTTILANDPDYSQLKLDYLVKEKHILTNDSLHRYLDQIIYDSQSYRNVLLQAYYEFEIGQQMNSDEEEKVYELLNEAFADYPKRLFAPTKKKEGVYLYLPRIDSMRNVLEKTETIMNQATLMRQNLNGSLSSLPLHFAIICFPYSNIDEMFADIQFAKRMGKVTNVYLPMRTNNLTDISNLVHREAVNLNYVNRLLSLFSSLDVTKRSSEVVKEIETNLQFFLAYMRIDQGGMILLDDSDKTFKVEFQEGVTNVGFKKGQDVEEHFIRTLESILDDDHTYYAATRKNLSTKIAEAADRNGMVASFFYAFYGEDGNLRGILYFHNYKNNLVLDTYMREALVMICSKIGDYYVAKASQGRLHEEQRVNASLLKLSDYGTYKINPFNYELIEFSSSIADACSGKINKGDVCYKTLYGLSSPCENCPLRTSKKMKSTLGQYVVETSLTLNEVNRLNTQKILLTKRIQNADNEYMDDPYDANLLVNSYYMLTLSMKNAYILSSRGYVLLLKIDNQMELVSKYGSEAFNQALRAFAGKITQFETINNVYFYKPDTLAILLTGYGQIDCVNECEAIYDLSQQSFFTNPEEMFRITYLPVSYPQGYPSHADFLRHCEDFYFSKKYESGKDYIYFDESDYSRPASANAFMLSVIDDKFQNKDFTVNLQPLVETSTKKIMGAELLLRLADEYRKIIFDTDKLIKVAAKNGKINLISSSLLEYVSNLYSQYGNSVFRMYGFKRLTINTDSSYLADSTLPDQVKALYENYHLPKNFLGFEINEKDIYDHFADMKKFIATLSNLGVKFIVDRYTGQYLSFNRLKELHLDEIKIDRAYTRYIDSDKSKYTMVRSLLEEAKLANVRVGLIGVENMEQYKIIHEINPDSYLQGYAFFKPLERQAMVEALKKTNTIIKMK